MQAIENMQVTGIQFVDITVPAPTESDPSATRISQQVRLAVRDLNRTERQGGVVFYEVNSTGGIHLDSVFKKTGFCDKVIDINEKYEQRNEKGFSVIVFWGPGYGEYICARH